MKTCEEGENGGMLDCCQELEAFDNGTKHDAASFLSTGYLAENTSSIQKLSVGIYRLLGNGTAVTFAALAQKLSMDVKETGTLLSELPPSAIQYNDGGVITAFIGLSLAPTPHRLLLDHRVLYTWCVFDGLFLPEILGKSANIITHCPVTGEKISVHLASDKLISYEPRDAVMSVVTPDAQSCRNNLRGAFCEHVSFFLDTETFRLWAENKENIKMMALEDAYLLARQQNKARYKDIHL